MMDWTGANGLRIGGRLVSDQQLLRIAWITLLSTCAVSMLIHALSGHARAIPFFISESDYPGAERIVFRLGLTISGGLLCLLALRLSYALPSKSSPRATALGKYSGLTTGVFLVLLSWFSMHDHLVIHCIFASITFASGYFWAYAIHASLADQSSVGHRWRQAWLMAGIVSYAVMNLVLARPIRDFVLEGGLRDGTTVMNLAQRSIDIAAPAEYLFFFSIVMMLASFEHDLSEGRKEETLLQ